MASKGIEGQKCYYNDKKYAQFLILGRIHVFILFICSQPSSELMVALSNVGILLPRRRVKRPLERFSHADSQAAHSGNGWRLTLVIILKLVGSRHSDSACPKLISETSPAACEGPSWPPASPVHHSCSSHRGDFLLSLLVSFPT